MKISILSLTIDRLDTIQKCYKSNIDDSGFDRSELELMVADNGSKDAQVIDYMASLGLAYHRLNKVNEGVGRAFNQLLNRVTGDYICLMGTDIKLQPGWLRELINYAEAVPNAGIVGIRCTADIPPLTTRQDKYERPCHAHYLDQKYDKVFGTMLFSKNVLEIVGGFHEGFHPYGFEDSDFNNRVNLAGFTSLYVPASAWVSEHIGNDCGESSDYRRMKDQSLARNLSLFGERCNAFQNKTLQVHEPLPPRRSIALTAEVFPEIELSPEAIEAVRRTP